MFHYSRVSFNRHWWRRGWLRGVGDQGSHGKEANWLLRSAQLSSLSMLVAGVLSSEPASNVHRHFFFNNVASNPKSVFFLALSQSNSVLFQHRGKSCVVGLDRAPGGALLQLALPEIHLRSNWGPNSCLMNSSGSIMAHSVHTPIITSIS